METLQRWVLLFCCGAVLYGVVENLLPRQGVFPVIKAVAVLYIVLILLSPIKNVEQTVPKLLEMPQSVSPQPEDAQRAVLERAAVLVKERLASALRAAGADVRIGEVVLSQTNGSVYVLFCGGAEARAEVERLCDEQLGVKGVYEWKEG